MDVRVLSSNGWVLGAMLLAVGCAAQAPEADDSVSGETSALHRPAHHRHVHHHHHHRGPYHPDGDARCRGLACDDGQHCELVQVECITTPCNPVPSCVPDEPEGPFCGGIAGIPCAGQAQCEDAPGDGCNPMNGGADCGGICRCVETKLCARGLMFDADPEVCDCVQDPSQDPCAAVRCASGTHCVANAGQASCDKDVFCGGIAAFMCPGLGTCVDNPNDSCDPDNGGADCGGLCQCDALAKCSADATFNRSASVCDCVSGS